MWYLSHLVYKPTKSSAVLGQSELVLHEQVIIQKKKRWCPIIRSIYHQYFTPGKSVSPSFYCISKLSFRITFQESLDVTSDTVATYVVSEVSGDLKFFRRPPHFRRQDLIRKRTCSVFALLRCCTSCTHTHAKKFLLRRREILQITSHQEIDHLAPIHCLPNFNIIL